MIWKQGLVVAAATTIAFWPAWAWYGARAQDGADEKWGLLAILCAAGIALMAHRRARALDLPRTPFDPPLVPIALLAILHTAFFLLGLPALIRAILALTAVALVVSAYAFGRLWHPGTAALLLLGLPLEATLQFYAGYPLRIWATWLSASLLRLFGLHVEAADTLLLWKGEAVGVDAPCSGIHMLWVALFFAALVAAARDFGAVHTVIAGVLAAAVVIPANGLRVAALFLKEARVVPLPGWTHAAIGAAIFSGAVVAILFLVSRVERWRSRGGPPNPPEPSGPSQHDDGWESGEGRPRSGASSQRSRAGETRSSRRRRSLAAYAAVCVLAGSASLLPRGSPARSETAGFPGWPEVLDGRALVPVPSTPEDVRFTRGFPGRFARFADGDRTVLLRWLPGPSRQLHPAMDCFRGAGYTIHQQPVRIGPRGERWGCIEATRRGRSVIVCERIFDQRGQSWTDPSSWWWAAALGRAEGPYWAITIVEPSS